MRVLGTNHRLRVRKCGEGLVPLGWEEQTFKVATEAVSLIPLPKERIELPAIGFKWIGSRRDGEALCHDEIS
jgi:hypothetical protein